MKLADGQSLLQKTYLRAAAVAGGEIFTVTNRDYYFISKDGMAGANPGDGHLGEYHLDCRFRCEYFGEGYIVRFNDICGRC